MSRQQKTKVMLNGQDVSSIVMAVSLPRYPEQVEVVELKLIVDSLSVTPDGTLVIDVKT